MAFGMPRHRNSSDFNFRSLGPDEARVVLELASKYATTATPKIVQRILGSGDRAHNVIRRLLAKGWLQRASNGHYVFIPPDWGAEKIEDYDIYILASASVDTGYIGWWAAASRHGFTTQVPNVIHVATDHQVPSREIQGNPVRYVKLSPKKFFGWQEMLASGRSYRISTPEKTVVDCVDRPDLCGGATELSRIVARAAETVAEASLVDTALRLGSVSTCQRLGYLLDLTSPSRGHAQAARRRLREFIPLSARSTFGRRSRNEGDVGYVPAWGLLVNAVESDLTSEIFGYKKAFGP